MPDSNQVTLALLKQDVDLLRDEVKAQRKATEDLLEAWRAATGLLKFVKWLASVIAAFSLIVATIKFGLGKHP